MLLAMLADDEKENRTAAISFIKAIRQAPGASQPQIREFRPPEIKDDAETLQDLLPPVDECTMEPPLTRQLSDEELENIADVPLTLPIPCHSQGVERCVRLVTESSNAVFGKEARDGYIRALTKSRHFMPSLESKKDFYAPSDG